MKAFNDLYDFILPYLPGAEQGIVDLHIRRTLREFFARTTVWRETFVFNTVGGVAAYRLQPSIGTVASVLTVEIDGKPTTAIPEDMRTNPAPGAAERWYSLIPETFVLYPSPSGVQAIRVDAAITLPVDGSLREFPDDVYNAHAESIAAGVISSMMAMPGKPWSQRESSLLYSRVFGSAVRDLRGKLRDGGQPNQSTFTSPRRFGA